MRDFNFFTDLKPKKKKTTSTSTYVVLVVLLLALAIGGSYYYFYLELEEVDNDIARIEGQLYDETFVAQHDEVEAMNTELASMEQERREIDRIDFSIESNRVIGNLLINEIAMAKPENVALMDINFNNRDINLEGSSTNINDLAVFELNLRANERFEGPFIPNIEEVDDELFTFSLSFHIVEEEDPFAIDETEEPEEEEGDEDGA
jgi:Tfp pilus assembly protein PilN